MSTAHATAQIAIGIGANLGDAKSTVHAAIRTIENHDALTKIRASSLYRSAPVNASGPDYINAVVTAQTALTPNETLSLLHAIENAAGRKRPYRNAPRTLDLDLLLYDNLQMDTATLTLPHPRMHLRAFVLLPLAEITDNVSIPGHGAVNDLLNELKEQAIEIEVTR